MTAEELFELLSKVRMPGTYSYSYRTFSREELGAIAGALLPTINKRIEAARNEKQ